MTYTRCSFKKPVDYLIHNERFAFILSATYSSSARRGQERAPDPLDWELQTVQSPGPLPEQVLLTELPLQPPNAI